MGPLTLMQFSADFHDFCGLSLSEIRSERIDGASTASTSTAKRCGPAQQAI